MAKKKINKKKKVKKIGAPNIGAQKLYNEDKILYCDFFRDKLNEYENKLNEYTNNGNYSYQGSFWSAKNSLRSSGYEEFHSHIQNILNIMSIQDDKKFIKLMRKEVKELNKIDKTDILIYLLDVSENNNIEGEFYSSFLHVLLICMCRFIPTHTENGQLAQRPLKIVEGDDTTIFSNHLSLFELLCSYNYKNSNNLSFSPDMVFQYCIEYNIEGVLFNNRTDIKVQEICTDKPDIRLSLMLNEISAHGNLDLLRKRKFTVPEGGIFLKLQDESIIHVKEVISDDMAYVVISSDNGDYYININNFKTKITYETAQIHLLIVLRMYGLSDIINNTIDEIMEGKNNNEIELVSMLLSNSQLGYTIYIPEHLNRKEVQHTGTNKFRNQSVEYVYKHIGHFVRKLGRGEASEQAKELAKLYHIDLAKGYTFVKDHKRKYIQYNKNK